MPPRLSIIIIITIIITIPRRTAARRGSCRCPSAAASPCSTGSTAAPRTGPPCTCRPAPAMLWFMVYRQWPMVYHRPMAPRALAVLPPPCYGLWPIAYRYGLWSMSYGLRPQANGPPCTCRPAPAMERSMAAGRPAACRGGDAYGLRPCHLWSMACGLRPMVYGLWSTAAGRPAACRAGDRRPRLVAYGLWSMSYGL